MNEEEILRGVRQGGRAMDVAVRALYDGTARHMLGFFVYRGVSPDEARDILQETFVKVVRNVDSYRGDGAARSWIWQIARNCLTDHLRKRARVSEDEVTLSDEQWQDLGVRLGGPTCCVPGESAQECVERGLQAFALKMPERAHVLGLHMEGLTMSEIGTRIGRTAVATKEYLSQCRKRIQPFIAHCTELLQP